MYVMTQNVSFPVNINKYLAYISAQQTLLTFTWIESYASPMFQDDVVKIHFFNTDGRIVF
jgi:hypothetical protein